MHKQDFQQVCVRKRKELCKSSPRDENPDNYFQTRYLVPRNDLKKRKNLHHVNERRAVSYPFYL
ncbi:MAG: hypothetical protein AB2L20_06285 [Mangrovibacterium sp.]